MRLNQSFSARLSLYVILLTSVLSLAGLVTAVFFSIKTINRKVVEKSAAVLDIQIRDIEKILVEVESGIESMAWVLEENLQNPKHVTHVCERLVERNPFIYGARVSFIPYYYPSIGKWFSSYAWVGDDGKVHSCQQGGKEYDYLKKEWYQLPMALKSNIWLEPYKEEENFEFGQDEYLTTYSIPLHNNMDRCVGVLQADVSLNELTTKLSSMKAYEHSYSFMIGRAGTFISHPDSTLFNTTTIFDLAEKTENKELMELGRKMIAGASGSMRIDNFDGESSYFTFGPLSNGWSMGIVCPTADVFQDVKRMNTILIFLIILELLFLFIAVKRVVSKATTPIIKFAYAALSIGKGNFKTKIPGVKTCDELRRLHDSLEYMLMSFNDYIEQLKLSTASNQRYESELNIASSIQRQMLPSSFPKSEAYDVYARLIPAKEIGGDMYDFLCKDKFLVITIGDVSGKGVPAALYMAMTRFASHFIAGLGFGLDGVISRINKSFSEGNNRMMFETMFVAKINLETYEMEYCNAGHNPIVLISPDGKAEYLHAKSNLAVGLVSDFNYEMERITLSKGFRLLLYTDGVTEAEDASKNLYGEERLIEFAESISSEASSREVVDSLISSVKEFTGDNEQNDDITVLTVKL